MVHFCVTCACALHASCLASPSHTKSPWICLSLCQGTKYSGNYCCSSIAQHFVQGINLQFWFWFWSYLLSKFYLDPLIAACRCAWSFDFTLIAVADGSIGHIAVTTPWIRKLGPHNNRGSLWTLKCWLQSAFAFKKLSSILSTLIFLYFFFLTKGYL